jgi:hypothetical protein
MSIPYKKAPVIERVASLKASMDAELFESRLASWDAIARAEFPVYEPLREWLLNIEEKDDIPLWNTLKRELRITSRFSKKSSKEGFDWSLRCDGDQFTMNMHSNHRLLRAYDDLRREYSKWLPLWMEHFQISEVESIHLIYVNLLNPETLSVFVRKDEDGSVRLDIDKALKVFVNNFGEHDLLVPPFRV